MITAMLCDDINEDPFSFSFPPEEIQTIVDLGGHVGLWTLAAADTYKDATIYTVEPVPQNLAHLQSNLGRNLKDVSRIKLVDAAIWDGFGEIDLKLQPYNSGAAGVFNDYAETVKCKTISLDALIDTIEKPIDLMKIDIEASEYVVFKAFNRWDKLRRVQLEAHNVVDPNKPGGLETNEKLCHNLIQLFNDKLGSENVYALTDRFIYHGGTRRERKSINFDSSTHEIGKFMGHALTFDVDMCVKYVESLVNSDEVERALLVLDNVPAYYRRNADPRLTALRKEIVHSICTIHSYTDDQHDCDVKAEHNLFQIENLLRGKLMLETVKALNAKDQTPLIIDYGPGEYMLPLALKEGGYLFGYKPLFLDKKAYTQFFSLSKGWAPRKGDSPVLFVAWEVIEHMPHPEDLATEALRCNNGEWPDEVHLSTPFCTFDGSEKKWRKPGGLPHLRAYTPEEFLIAARNIFPGYAWQLYLTNIMSLVGKRERADESRQ